MSAERLWDNVRKATKEAVATFSRTHHCLVAVKWKDNSRCQFVDIQTEKVDQYFQRQANPNKRFKSVQILLEPLAEEV